MAVELGWFGISQKELESVGGGEFWEGLATIQPAAWIERGRLMIAPGLLAEIALLHGSGVKLTDPSAGSVWLARLGVAAEAMVRMTAELALSAGARVAVPVARPVFEVDGEELFEPAGAHVHVTLGLRYDWQRRHTSGLQSGRVASNSAALYE